MTTRVVTSRPVERVPGATVLYEKGRSFALVVWPSMESQLIARTSVVETAGELELMRIWHDASKRKVAR